MKKFAIAVMATGVLTLAACSSQDDSEAVVETKAGNVTKEEFYNALQKESGETVLQELVMKKVLEDNYDVKDSDVDDQLKQLKEQYGDQFESVLQQSGFSDEDAFKEVLRLNMLQEKAITEGIEVTDEEINQKYERMQTEVKASHILVSDEETAKKVKKQLDEGKDFAQLAKDFSTDTASAENGGDLGFFGTGAMVPEFEDAAYGMEVGAVSDPVQTDNGWHIIKVTDKREVEDVEPLEDIKDDVKREIANSKVDNAKAQEKLNKLIEDADVDVKIEDFKDLFKTEKAAS
ncbi:peptidylprolyl isomerase [Radiobacillus kanasensis]|uniref:peptidylprolyl isomerase n=1 Tax=Radiobacillus kanasensis TaxID=2844358 RepID=UPI001E2B2EE7|nr:peptidylprolyl isomerase [Radiobacillus kanasensis]UFU00482.1 peptidylprolyl isomerase [Radiobacillus kanasensis]